MPISDSLQGFRRLYCYFLSNYLYIPFQTVASALVRRLVNDGVTDLWGHPCLLLHVVGESATLQGFPPPRSVQMSHAREVYKKRRDYGNCITGHAPNYLKSVNPECPNSNQLCLDFVSRCISQMCSIRVATLRFGTFSIRDWVQATLTDFRQPSTELYVLYYRI